MAMAAKLLEFLEFLEFFFFFFFFFFVVVWVSLRVCLGFSPVKSLYVLKGFRFCSVSCTRPRLARQA